MKTHYYQPGSLTETLCDDYLPKGDKLEPLEWGISNYSADCELCIKFRAETELELKIEEAVKSD